MTVSNKKKPTMHGLLLAAMIVIGLAVSPMPVALAHEAHSHNLPVVAGKVTKIDEAAGKVTIAHDAIPNLQMEAMTMVFKVGNPSMVAGLRPGDAINFTADKVNDQLTVTEIEKR